MGGKFGPKGSEDSLSRDDPMTLCELLETLKAFGVTLALHDGDTITAEPPEVLTPAVRAALAEHHAALVALIRSRPSSTSSFDTLLSGLDGLGARPPAELLQERLRTLADGLAGADPLVRELARAEAIARLTTLDPRAATFAHVLIAEPMNLAQWARFIAYHLRVHGRQIHDLQLAYRL